MCKFRMFILIFCGLLTACGAKFQEPLAPLTSPLQEAKSIDGRICVNGLSMLRIHALGTATWVYELKDVLGANGAYHVKCSN